MVLYASSGTVGSIPMRLRHTVSWLSTGMSDVACSIDEAAVSAHLEGFLGKARFVLHSMGSPLMPHVYYYPATPARRRATLVTAGLSGFAMPAPEPHLARAELMTYLPATWEPPSDFQDPAMWPVAMLRTIVAYAISQKAFLGNLHTIPNLATRPAGGPYVSGSALSAVVLLPPVHEPAGFDDVTIQSERLRFLHALPITAAECQAKIDKGFHAALAPLLDSGAIPIVADAERRSAV
jgi:hypothetical protein